MNRICFFSSILVLIAVNGCVTKYRPELDVKEAWMMSEGDRVELAFPSESELVNIHEFYKKLHLTGRINDVYAVFGPLPGGTSFLIYTGRERKAITFNEATSFYQSDSGDRRALNVVAEERLTTVSPYWSVQFSTPPELQDTTSMGRGSLTPQNAERMKRNDDILHRFHFEFTVDDVPHVIDVLFELEVNAIWEPRVPATP